ncbi:hypothetical protein llap_9295 [Limosa lapponica baueri]|uniref:Uncharacterized protein n=1 Tax=Limosa lapponica baueri TaxID=1758121 RepID=A0A2I0U2U1_LIMLA|nr:hypothetical protein llap_9295 [Limosa lapponica baueri]
MYLSPRLTMYPVDLDSDMWTQFLILTLTRAPGFTPACHVTMDLHDDLDSWLIPAAIPRPALLSFLEVVGRAVKAPALLAMALSYPALGEQLTLTCILIPGLGRVIQSSQHKCLNSSQFRLHSRY